MKSYVSEVELAVAVQAAHRVDSALLSARIERLTAVLREHGLPIPGVDPRLGASDGEHLEACRKVVAAAYDLLERIDAFNAALSELRDYVGSGMELVEERWQ